MTSFQRTSSYRGGAAYMHSGTSAHGVSQMVPTNFSTSNNLVYAVWSEVSEYHAYPELEHELEYNYLTADPACTLAPGHQDLEFAYSPHSSIQPSTFTSTHIAPRPDAYPVSSAYSDFYYPRTHNDYVYHTATTYDATGHHRTSTPGLWDSAMCMQATTISTSNSYDPSFKDKANTTSEQDNTVFRCAISTFPYPSSSPEAEFSQSVILTCRPRNVQVAFSSSAPNAMDSTQSQANRWNCPYCPYAQHNHRSPDLRRHIATHKRRMDAPLWICCGVPVVSARALGVPLDVARDGAIFEFQGVQMVGGCRKTFSRRDALKRHLKRTKGRCWGDVLSLHQPGNRLGSDNEA